jgi:2,3-bisphosphoglycerate-dependent phosphoglycerate mutase
VFLILARHGRTTANAAGVLAGRSAGVGLDDIGKDQAQSAAERLAGLSIARVVSSPMQRCLETAELLAPGVSVDVDERLTECDYGDWTGQTLAELAKEPLWRTVQRQPSAAVFPGGESMTAMSNRAVDAARELSREIGADAGEHAVWLAVSHGDVIKAILADALGMHLDAFQRIGVNPASLSLVHYGHHRASVLAMNTIAGALPIPPKPVEDAPVGGAPEATLGSPS